MILLIEVFVALLQPKLPLIFVPLEFFHYLDIHHYYLTRANTMTAPTITTENSNNHWTQSYRNYYDTA